MSSINSGTEYDLPDQGLPRYQTGGRVDDVIIALVILPFTIAVSVIVFRT